MKRKLSKGEKVLLIGIGGCILSVLTLEGSFWVIGMCAVAVFMLIGTTGMSMINAEENEKKYRAEIRRRRYEAAEKAKAVGKEITFQTWLDTRRMGGTF